jgi:hypothetical protein
MDTKKHASTDIYIHMADCTEQSWKRLLSVSRTGALLQSPRKFWKEQEGTHDSKNKGPRNDKFVA